MYYASYENSSSRIHIEKCFVNPSWWKCYLDPSIFPYYIPINIKAVRVKNSKYYHELLFICNKSIVYGQWLYEIFSQSVLTFSSRSVNHYINHYVDCPIQIQQQLETKMKIEINYNTSIILYLQYNFLSITQWKLNILMITIIKNSSNYIIILETCFFFNFNYYYCCNLELIVYFYTEYRDEQK